VDIGVRFILFLQSLGDWLTTPMQFFSLLGNEEFYLLLMPILYWCVDAKLGLRMGIMLLICNGIVDILKLCFHTPRPYWYDPHVQAINTEGSFGLPSGHAQNGIVVWGGLAASLRKRWVWTVSIAIILLISLSRVYVGVHFPTDVIAGWVVGIIILLAYLTLESSVKRWLTTQSFLMQVLVALVFSLLTALFAVLARLALKGYRVPTTWIQTAKEAAPEAETIVPMALSGSFSTAGALFGIALGAIWLRRVGGYEARGVLKERIGRFFIGLLGVLLTWWVLGTLLPRGEFLLAYVLRYLRYALVGVWITGVAPLVFIKIGLARSGSSDDGTVHLSTFRSTS
jgi:membrane-associated phospholipid phosphatase